MTYYMEYRQVTRGPCHRDKAKNFPLGVVKFSRDLTAAELCRSVHPGSDTNSSLVDFPRRHLFLPPSLSSCLHCLLRLFATDELGAAHPLNASGPSLALRCKTLDFTKSTRPIRAKPTIVSIPPRSTLQALLRLRIPVVHRSPSSSLQHAGV